MAYASATAKYDMAQMENSQHGMLSLGQLVAVIPFLAIQYME
jgi:hypothetical protein